MPPLRARAQQSFDLEEVASDLGVAVEELQRAAPRVLEGATKKSRRHVVDSTLDLLLAKRETVERRVFPAAVETDAREVQARVNFREDHAPLLTSFQFSGGAPGRGPKLRVKTRKGEAAKVYKGAFRRPNRNGSAFDSTPSVSYQRVRRPDGSLVGRMPYRVAAGPSVLGLLQSRPGFADGEVQYLADETINGFGAAADRLLANLEAA